MQVMAEIWEPPLCRHTLFQSLYPTQFLKSQVSLTQISTAVDHLCKFTSLVQYLHHRSICYDADIYTFFSLTWLWNDNLGECCTVFSCILPAEEVVEKVMLLSAGEQPSECSTLWECKCWVSGFPGFFPCFRSGL